MFEIPQEEIDKIDNGSSEGIFPVDADEEEETDESDEVTQEEVKEQVSAPTDEDAVADKARVPYSRFETVNEARIRAEERLAILESQSEAKKSDGNKETTDDLKDWLELWGDSEESRQAYEIDQRRQQRAYEESRNRLLEDIENHQNQKQQEVEDNLNYIQEGLDNFQEKLGRKLSETEESAVLDIQDEFTAKDDKGNYIAPLMSTDKAFEIYTLRNQNAKVEKNQARRRVVSITGSSSESEGVNDAFANYNPSVGGLWESKL